MAHTEHSTKTKQHALRRDVHRRHPLWVYDDDDWTQMRSLPTGDLICPQPGCRAELVPVEIKSTMTRHLRNRVGTSDCGHAFGRGQDGGPPSDEQRWLQQRLAMLCDILGYSTIPDHFESNADVWVDHTPPLAIKVQRSATAFSTRSSARQDLGTRVLRLVPESASKKTGIEMFRHPAARIRVMKRENRSVEARPWEPGHTGPVLLWIGATVMRLASDNQTLVSAGNYEALKFLREVLEGERTWFGPNEPGIKGGAGWVRIADMEVMRDARRQAAKTRSPWTMTAEPVSSEPTKIELATDPDIVTPESTSPVPTPDRPEVFPLAPEVTVEIAHDPEPVSELNTDLPLEPDRPEALRIAPDVTVEIAHDLEPLSGLHTDLPLEPDRPEVFPLAPEVTVEIAHDREPLSGPDAGLPIRQGWLHRLKTWFAKEGTK